jgi:hypothetical protein
MLEMEEQQAMMLLETLDIPFYQMLRIEHN